MGRTKIDGILHTKTDILWQCIKRYFKNLYSYLEKKRIRAAAFISSSVCGPYNRLKNLSAGVKATRN